MVGRVTRRRFKIGPGLISLLISLAIVVILVGTPPSLGQSIDQLRQQQQQLEQQRRTMQQEQNRLQNLETSAQTELKGLQDNIQVTAAQIRENEQKLAAATATLNQLQVKLMAAEAAYDNMQRSTVARLQFLQRQQGTTGWAVLLQSQNLNQFLDRRQQLRRVYEADQTFLAELEQQAAAIATQRAEVERQKNEIALLTQQLQVQKQEFEAQANTQQTLVSRLKSDRQALEAAESKLAQDSASMANLIRQKVAEQEAARRRASGIYVQGSGQFSYPINAQITSNFGTRVHPILGYRKFHAGIDFGASHGTTIRAADTGTVIFAGWYGGYGRSVIIDHGGGLTSLYAHASALYVKDGEAIQKGQPIAAVGSTGLSTGPHLHFEVRRNGDPVNPMNYL